MPIISLESGLSITELMAKESERLQKIIDEKEFLIRRLTDAISILEDENDTLLSSYGDAWYDGYMAARASEQEWVYKNIGYSIVDASDDEILKLSEDAETKYKGKKNDKTS